MTRVLGRDMLKYRAGAVRLALSFLVIYGTLTLPGAFPALTEAQGVGAAQTASLGTANLAAVLALTIMLTAAAIGLYRPEICIERRRLLINAGVACLLAFPIVLLVNGSFNIGLPHHAVLLMSKVLLVWLVCILASRVIFSHIMRERWFIKRILVLGSAPHIARLRQLANGARGRLFEPVVAAQEAGAGVVDQSLSPGALRRQHIWGIVIAGERTNPNSLPVAALLDCKLRGVPVFDRAGFCEEQLGRIDLDRTRDDWLLFADGFARGQTSATRPNAASTSASAPADAGMGCARDRGKVRSTAAGRCFTASGAPVCSAGRSRCSNSAA